MRREKLECHTKVFILNVRDRASHKIRIEIMQKIGQLFLLRTNINSVGSVLDSPVGIVFPV